MKYEEIIDRFILGQMTAQEEKHFLEACKTNKELKEEAIMTAYLVKALGNMPRPY